MTEEVRKLETEPENMALASAWLVWFVSRRVWRILKERKKKQRGLLAPVVPIVSFSQSGSNSRFPVDV